MVKGISLGGKDAEDEHRGDLVAAAATGARPMSNF